MLRRQRQYFEQKKRQQQRPEVQSQVDVAGEGSHAYHDQSPRSLDVLNLNNLATPNSHHSGPENVDSVVPPLDCTLLNASPIEALKKVTSVCSNLKEASSQPRLSSPSDHQDGAASANPYEEPLGCKMPPPKNKSVKKRNPNLELNSKISLFDLVSDEGPNSKSTTRPAREAHVSFSVKGLGHVKMETPPQSPRSIKRTLPLPPKVTQNKARRSIPFDATKELDFIINDINMLKERRFSEKRTCLLDESGYERSKQSNCYFPHSFENHNDKFFPEDEDMFCEPQAENGWQSNHGRLDDNLTDENSERLWKMESFNSEYHFPTPRVEQFDTLDYGFKDRYTSEQRTSTRMNTRFETSGIPATHDLFSDHSLMDNGNDTVLFDWERHPPIKKVSNSNSTFGPSAWSFDMVDDSEKRRSPISEESCSSAAVMKDGSCKKPSLSVECEENKMNEKDDFHISFDKLDIPKRNAHLDGISLFNNLEEHHKRIDDQNNLEDGYWSDKATEKQRTREPSCRLSLKEKFSKWGATSPTAHLKGGTGLNNPSSCTMLHEDKPFNSVSDMSTYQTVGSSSPERRPASKVPPIFHRPDNAIFDDGIHLQSSVSDIFGDKIEFSKPTCSKGLQSEIDMSTFLAEKVEKRKEDSFDTSNNRNADMFLTKKSVSSVSQNVVGQHRSCPQQPGKDSLRQGFSPGIDFQDSRLNSFWEDGHADNGTFQGDIELNDLLTRKNSDKNEDKIEKLSKPETKMLTETPQAYADHRNEMREAETCSDGSEVANPPGTQKQTSLAAQVSANLGCLQETSREMLKVHAHVECVKKERIENPCVDFNTPLQLRNKIPDVDHSKSNFMFHSPLVGEEVGIEKKIIASVSPNNSDVQYKVMFEHRVLRRLCVQKIVVDTPIKNKLDKDNHFRKMEDGYHVLPRSV
ncbi:hypothetical protein E2562_034806 [Oryza meyeriana var. granulata]|uniref:Uncharacterized protein n=1 Tax=Oryza meyeriana var. granulata TaxID=110450 RepID=A0A6G1E6E2_9ORYZ|nr:hypothetical protein E2562_034806 [Oryza meyeriana var. granulata]